MKLLVKISLSLFLVLSFVSCANNETADAPIAPKDMQAILLDIHTAEYYSQGLGKHKGTYMKEYDSLAFFYSSIFKHHNINIDKFTEALNWYKKHPALLDSIYINLKDEVSAMQDKGKSERNSDAIIPISSMKDGLKKPEEDSTNNSENSTSKRQNILSSQDGRD